MTCQQSARRVALEFDGYEGKLAKATRKRRSDAVSKAGAEELPAPAHARPLPVIKVVGVSASGKSTLARALRGAGYDARPVSQEHSSVPTLWKQFGIPKTLIYLDVSLAAQKARRSDVSWSEEHRTQEVERLADARSNADLVIDTSTQTGEEVREIALAFLTSKRIRKASGALPPLGETGAPNR